VAAEWGNAADGTTEGSTVAGWLGATAPVEIECVNLSMCQQVAAVGRRVMTLCKDEDGVRQQLALYHAY
jgi:hypothetical protein